MPVFPGPARPADLLANPQAATAPTAPTIADLLVQRGGVAPVTAAQDQAEQALYQRLANTDLTPTGDKATDFNRAAGGLVNFFIDRARGKQAAAADQEATEQANQQRLGIAQMLAGSGGFDNQQAVNLASMDPQNQALALNVIGQKRAREQAVADQAAADERFERQFELSREKFDAGRSDAEADEAFRREKLGVDQSTAERKLGADLAGDAAKATEKNVELTNKLRDKFHAQAGKPVQNIAEGLQGLRGAATQETAAGDLSLLFSYGKVLDPGSVVREGELATLSDLGGVGDRLMRLGMQVQSGQRLTPKMRAEIIEAAEVTASSKIKTFQPVIDQYTNFAQELDLDPADIIPDYAGIIARPGDPVAEEQPGAVGGVAGPDIADPTPLAPADLDAAATEFGVPSQTILDAASEAGVDPSRVIERLRAKRGG